MHPKAFQKNCYCLGGKKKPIVKKHFQKYKEIFKSCSTLKLPGTHIVIKYSVKTIQQAVEESALKLIICPLTAKLWEI